MLCKITRLPLVIEWLSHFQNFLASPCNLRRWKAAESNGGPERKWNVEILFRPMPSVRHSKLRTTPYSRPLRWVPVFSRSQCSQRAPRFPHLARGRSTYWNCGNQKKTARSERDLGSRVVSWQRLKSFIKKMWISFRLRWAEAAEIQQRIDAERLKIQERHGPNAPTRWH